MMTPSPPLRARASGAARHRSLRLPVAAAILATLLSLGLPAPLEAQRPSADAPAIPDSGDAAPDIPAGLRAGTCVIARIVDGDTVRCEDGRRIRLLLIDAPEMDQGPFGRVARRVLKELAPVGTPVTLERDVDPVDRYGRTLAYLYLPDGRMVNEELLRAGVAVVSVYPPNVQHVERLRRAVEEAREARRGLWATDAFECLPADHRAGRCGRHAITEVSTPS